MTSLVLVRHGETVHHAENRYTGISDIALTRRGHEQAERLGEWASAAGVTAVVSSPLTRARLTAGPAVERTSASLQVEDRLREVDFGALDGLTAAEAGERYPDEWRAFSRDPVEGRFPGAEDPRDAAARAQTALLEVAERHAGGRVLVVAHSTLLRLTLCRLLGLPLSAYRRVFPMLRNCALNEVRLGGGTFSLLSLNVPVELLALAAQKEAGA